MGEGEGVGVDADAEGGQRRDRVRGVLKGLMGRARGEELGWVQGMVVGLKDGHPERWRGEWFEGYERACADMLLMLHERRTGLGT